MACNNDAAARNFYGLQLTEKNTFLHCESESPSPNTHHQQRRNSAPHLGQSSSWNPSDLLASLRSTAESEQTQASAFASRDKGRSHSEDTNLKKYQDGKGEEVYSVMIKNIPCGCKREEVLCAIAEMGFADSYNFFHAPSRHGKTRGFAFIGFPDPVLTEQFSKSMTGYKFVRRQSPKVVEVVPANIQGGESIWNHFKDAFVMQTQWKPSFRGRESSSSDAKGL